MIRRILSVFRRDTKSSLRDSMVLMSILSPLLLALVMRAFIPSVGETTINFVVTADLGESLVEALRAYGRVEVVKDLAAVEARVRGWDDAAGIVRSGDGFEIILEGNESEETAVLPGLVLADILGPQRVGITERDLGRATSPLRPMFSSLLPIAGMLIGGLVIGLNVVEEKETNVASALGTTPLGRIEYVGGHSLLAIAVAIVIALVSLPVMGTWPVHVGQVAVITVAGTVLAVVAGLYIGGVANNQIEAVGVLKMIAIPFMTVPFLVFVVPAQWHAALYWIPTYWMAMAFRTTFEPGGSWAEVLRLVGIGLAVSLVFLGATWNMIRRRLVLRG